MYNNYLNFKHSPSHNAGLGRVRTNAFFVYLHCEKVLGQAEAPKCIRESEK